MLLAAVAAMLLSSMALGFLHDTTHQYRRRLSAASQFAAKNSTATSSSIARRGNFRQAHTNDNVWRPTVNDVERISYGKPAKKKGTGSRGVPHRLNEEERAAFDRARQHGFLQVAGSGWRSQRREAPLLNTHRSLCDARGQVSIVLHKGNAGVDDLVVDLSPLRTPDEFDQIASVCLESQSGGQIMFQSGNVEDNLPDDDDTGEAEQDLTSDSENPWTNKPIYQLPPYCVAWLQLPRSDAKALGRKLSLLFDTAEGERAPSKKPIGVKPGKSRRHGGYGIG